MLEEPFDTDLVPSALDPERPAPVQTPWGSFSLFVVDGEIHAVDSFCPHLQGPLFQGSVVDGIVTCPWHSWRFSLATGERVDLVGKILSGSGGSRDSLRTLEVSIGPRGTVLLTHTAS